VTNYQYRREPLTAEEQDKLVNACQTHQEKLVVWTLLDTGLRVSELASLASQNVLWQEKRIMVYGKGGPYGKKSKRRVVPLTDRARKLLEVQFATSNNGIGMSTRTIQRTITRVANRAMITKPVSPHVLRHSYAVTAIQKGISTRALQEFLGHDHLETTEIYLNLSPEEALSEFHRKW
jgi:integrase/recombinase XerD